MRAEGDFENFAIEKSCVFICFLTIAFRKPFKTLGVCNDFDTRAQRPRGCPLCSIFCNELLTWTHVEKQNLKFILVFTISSPCDGGLGISRQAPSYVKNKVFFTRQVGKPKSNHCPRRGEVSTLFALHKVEPARWVMELHEHGVVRQRGRGTRDTPRALNSTMDSQDNMREVLEKGTWNRTNW